MVIPKYIIVHHSGGTDSNPLQDSSNYTIQQCDTDHKLRFNMKSSLGWYVGYHYFMDKNGKITQTRIDTEEGAHCIGYNNHLGDPESKNAIGICLAGNFDATIPNQLQVDSLKSFITSKMAQYSIPKEKVVPHRTFANKSCYGSKLSDSWARDLINEKIDVKARIQALVAELLELLKQVQ